MALSGQFGFDPNLGDITIAAFARCGIRRTELTQQHMADAQFEANLLQSDMQGDGIQLYEVILETQDLLPGVSAYNVDPTTVFMLDVYIRQNSGVYGVGWLNNNSSFISWVNIYNSTMVWASSPNYVPGQPVPPAPIIQGDAGTIDRIIVPISRSDYTAIANKSMPGFPTSFWYDKLLQPTMYIWPVPTNFIPAGLQYYVMKRPQDAVLANGTQVQIPYEFYDYYCWGLAERLAFIYAPDKLSLIGPRKQSAWLRAMQASTENVPINIDAMTNSYFRIG